MQKSIAISSSDFTKPEQAEDFVRRTGVERLAVVFGNIHGIVTDQKESLDLDHLRTVINAVSGVAIVLHGASGIADDMVGQAIQAGITNVHFNTELRVAYQKGIAETLDAQPDQTTPYKLLARADEHVCDLVAQKTRVFMSNHR
jgi:fructose/tagatose bisphosphate aldolase